MSTLKSDVTPRGHTPDEILADYPPPRYRLDLTLVHARAPDSDDFVRDPESGEPLKYVTVEGVGLFIYTGPVIDLDTGETLGYCIDGVQQPLSEAERQAVAQHGAKQPFLWIPYPEKGWRCSHGCHDPRGEAACHAGFCPSGNHVNFDLSGRSRRVPNPYYAAPAVLVKKRPFQQRHPIIAGLLLIFPGSLVAGVAAVLAGPTGGAGMFALGAASAIIAGFVLIIKGLVR